MYLLYPNPTDKPAVAYAFKVGALCEAIEKLVLESGVKISPCSCCGSPIRFATSPDDPDFFEVRIKVLPHDAIGPN